MNEQELYRIVAGVVNGVLAASPAPAAAAGDRIPVEISAKHVHLSQEHVEALFGAGYTLTPKRDLSQPGQFLCEERVTVVGPKGTFKNVAVLGPVRSRTQVELSATDARALGVKAPLRLSGDLAGCPGVFIQAGDAMVRADESVMVAQNHIHMTPADAQRLGVHDGEVVSVRMDTERPLTFDHVLVRATDTSALAMHIDFDEANACQLAGSGFGTIVRHAAGAPCAPVGPGRGGLGARARRGLRARVGSAERRRGPDHRLVRGDRDPPRARRRGDAPRPRRAARQAHRHPLGG